MSDRIPMTRVGYDKLKADLAQKEQVEMPKILERIAKARSDGDLSENAEYKAALERQSYVKARIAQLRERLATIASFSPQQVPADRVGIGSAVTLLDLDSDEEITYKLVFPEIADLSQGLISIASPIGRSLVGLRDGDTVEVTIPSGTKRFEVLELRTIHDK